MKYLTVMDIAEHIGGNTRSRNVVNAIKRGDIQFADEDKNYKGGYKIADTPELTDYIAAVQEQQKQERDGVLITQKTAADRLNITLPTLQRYIREGKIEIDGIGKARPLVVADSVQRFGFLKTRNAENADKIDFVGTRVTVGHRYGILDGAERKIEFVRVEDAVIVAILDNRDNIVTINRHRAAVNPDLNLLELPATVVYYDDDEPEKSRLAAVESILDDIGVPKMAAAFLGSFYASPGYSTELFHVFYVQINQPVPEIKKGEWLSIREARFQDAKSELARLSVLIAQRIK